MAGERDVSLSWTAMITGALNTLERLPTHQALVAGTTALSYTDTAAAPGDHWYEVSASAPTLIQGRAVTLASNIASVMVPPYLTVTVFNPTTYTLSWTYTQLDYTVYDVYVDNVLDSTTTNHSMLHTPADVNNVSYKVIARKPDGRTAESNIVTFAECDRAAKALTRVFIDSAGNRWANDGVWMDKGHTPATFVNEYHFLDNPIAPMDPGWDVTTLRRITDMTDVELTDYWYRADASGDFGVVNIDSAVDNACRGLVPAGDPCYFQTDNLILAFIFKKTGGRFLVLMDLDMNILSEYQTSTGGSLGTVSTQSIAADPFGGWWIQWDFDTAWPGTVGGGVIEVAVAQDGTLSFQGDPDETGSWIAWTDPTASRALKPVPPDEGSLYAFRVEYL